MRIIWSEIAQATFVRGDLVAELDEFALHTPVPPTRIVGCMRITSLRIEAVVDGRPGRRRLV